MRTEHSEDLELAQRALRGEDAAIRRISADLLEDAARVVSKFDPSADFAADVKQGIREKLFVSASGRPPKLTEYTGQGPLVAWLRAVCVGTALNLKRGPRDVPVDEVAELESHTVPATAELDLIRARDGEAFKAAFREAFASLTAQERTVLRLSVLDALSIDQIGALHGVHRATAARWLVRARETLTERTWTFAAEKLRLQPAEVDSLVRLLRSQLDVSLHRLLREG